MNRLCVVTGASGFIGQYVVHRLIERRARVRVLVRDPKNYRLRSGNTWK